MTTQTQSGEIEQSTTGLIKDFITLQKERTRISNELDTTLKRYIANRDEHEYKRQTANLSESFVSLCSELKEIREELEKRGDCQWLEEIKTIQESEKQKRDLTVELHSLMISGIGQTEENGRIRELQREIGDLGELINDSLSEMIVST
ncbi:hypothetical protein BLNAU_7856 [Blattamonas nauphoetae]|uniref:Uncharacterized protein n=1 Tax=Blattamonas nauphoetae TaxID=2049346 RepID=A0ABQ9Y0J6_9EUKA|nr:hypothetical protein BLNAU_7856 [Blattamonas nauphoetae]